MKTVFDVNQLDLAKVAKAFGFTTPPPVNINIGRSAKGGKKRKDRGSDIEAEGSDDDDDDESEEDEEETERQRRAKMARRGGTNQDRRRAVEGKKAEKDYYRESGREKLQQKGGAQWSR